MKVSQFHRKKIERFQVKITTLVLILLALLAAINYALFLINPLNAGSPIPYVLMLLGEFFIILHQGMSWFTVLAGSREVRDVHYYEAQKQIKSGKSLPAVDVFITVYGEPVDVVRQTLTQALQMKVTHTTYILDDGKSDEIKALTAELGGVYIRREQNTHAKAGNINNALGLSKGEYFAIFDADFAPKEDFLLKTLPFFHDEKVAFVQTPQVYRNRHQNIISSGAAVAQFNFYKLICPGKNVFNSVFCVGTNVVFCKQILIDVVGGIYEGSNSEDIWTSYILHQHGYKSVFLEEELAEGLAPDNSIDYLKQQLRWASGAFEIFFYQNPLFTKLNLDQKLQYFDTVIHYFSGFVIAISIFIPVVYLLFGAYPIHAYGGFWDWAIHFLPFFILQYVIVLDITGKNFINAIVVTTAAYTFYIQAFFRALFRQSTSWTATNVKRTQAKRYIGDYLFYHFVTIFILSAAVIAGLFNIKNSSLTLAYIGWSLVYIIIFGIFIYSSLKYHEK